MSHQISPRETVAQWLPHGFILSILGLALLMMTWVMQPLMPVLLMAAALSAFLYPLTAGPIHEQMHYFFPKLSNEIKRRTSGFLAVGILFLLALVPLVIMLFSMADWSSGLSMDLLTSLISKNLNNLDELFAKLTEQIHILKEYCPSLPIEPEMIRSYIQDGLKDFLYLQPALMSFLFKGTGSLVVQMLLCILAMVFFFAEGGIVVRSILTYTPLTKTDSEQLLSTFRNVILRLLIDTLGISVLKGTLLGILVGAFLGINPILLVFFASFICLLPLVGTTLIWAPAATALYKQGHLFQAILLAILCQIAIFGANMIMNHLGKKLHEHSATTSFFIFLSVIGGLVSFGFKGVILGPMAVILVMVLGRYWRDYYHECK
jgi:predicted PurR-regulated permease PerM